MSWLKYLENRKQPRTQEGFPIRGDHAPILRDEEYQRITLGFDAKVRVFDLSSEQDLRDYQDLLDHLANRVWIRLAPDRDIINEQTGTVKVLCRWAEVKGELPPEILQGVPY